MKVRCTTYLLCSSLVTAYTSYNYQSKQRRSSLSNYRNHISRIGNPLFANKWKRSRNVSANQKSFGIFTTTALYSSSHPEDFMMSSTNSTDTTTTTTTGTSTSSSPTQTTPSTIDMIQTWINKLKSNNQGSITKPPPIKIEDTSLLLYDIFLLLNLSVSISFWVVHRVDFLTILPSFSEGSLLCICWIISGLYNGAFLYSAANGHYDMRKEDQVEKGGPKAACMLGLNTMCTTASLRIIVALVIAIVEHRPVGVANGEELIPLEIGFGLVLMSSWRLLHSVYVSNFS